MNENKAMAELADRIERANDVTLDDGRLLPVREQRMIVAALRSSAPQADVRAALEPFAAVAENDIGQDETDADIFQPMRSGYNRAPLITVGDMRRAKSALTSPPSVALEARERAYEAARANLREAWAALAMIRETVETLAPSGAVKAAEHLDGPTFMHEADALVEGILALTIRQPGGAVAGTERGTP